MKAVLAYGVGSAVLLTLLSLAVIGVFPADGGAVRVAALVAWPVQLAAFIALVVGRRSGTGFMVSWAGGTLLRFAVVAVAAVWLTRAGALDPASLLLSLVGFVFVLVLLEPLFLRLAD